MNKHPIFLLLVLAAVFSVMLSACTVSPETRVLTSTPTLLPATPAPTKGSLAMETTTPQPARRIPNGIVYAIPKMESIIATHTDVSYSAENEALKLDIYAPSGLAADAR